MHAVTYDFMHIKCHIDSVDFVKGFNLSILGTFNLYEETCLKHFLGNRIDLLEGS